MCNASNQNHPNDRGYKFIADRIARTIQTYPWRAGQNTL
jgi:lysophospholipase L1-like esterase